MTRLQIGSRYVTSLGTCTQAWRAASRRHPDKEQPRGMRSRGCFRLRQERRPSFSLATPLNGALFDVFTAMMRPVEASRLALWPLDVLNCVLPVTEPIRLLLPVFFAIGGLLRSETVMGTEGGITHPKYSRSAHRRKVSNWRTERGRQSDAAGDLVFLTVYRKGARGGASAGRRRADGGVTTKQPRESDPAAALLTLFVPSERSPAGSRYSEANSSDFVKYEPFESE